MASYSIEWKGSAKKELRKIDKKEIQKLMNHKDINMTLCYMKLAEANKVSAVEGIY